ncbi:MAG: Ribosome recycling factor, partial [uncultured Corynebacteriales bacterium]
DRRDALRSRREDGQGGPGGPGRPRDAADRSGQPDHVRPAHGGLLRRADAHPADGDDHRLRGADGRHQAVRPEPAQRHREGDPGLRPGGQPVQRRHGHPGAVPAAHRGAPARARQGRAEQGRGREGLRPQHPPARQGRPGQAGQGRRLGGGRRPAGGEGAGRDHRQVRRDHRRHGQAQGSRAARGL